MTGLTTRRRARSSGTRAQAGQRRMALAILGRPDTPEHRRAILTEKVAFLEQRLDGVPACRNCGAPLADPVSIARRIGSDCWARGVRA